MGDYVYRGRSPRQDLEAKIWRWWPTRGPESAHAVDAILAAADTYVREMTACSKPLPDGQYPIADEATITAARRRILGDATCKPRERKPA